MKFGADIHGPQRMHPNDFGDPLAFPLVLPLGQDLNLSNTLVYDQIPKYLQVQWDQPQLHFVFSTNGMALEKKPGDHRSH